MKEKKEEKRMRGEKIMGRVYRNFGCIPMAKAMLLSYN
jgi:hypothetical protein